MLTKRITHNGIFALVNSIQAVPFTTKGTQIWFQYIVDSRWDKSMQPKIESMVKRFREKADKEGLEYRVGKIRKLTFGEPEPGKQLRVGISITKPRYQTRK